MRPRAKETFSSKYITINPKTLTKKVNRLVQCGSDDILLFAELRRKESDEKLIGSLLSTNLKLYYVKL